MIHKTIFTRQSVDECISLVRRKKHSKVQKNTFVLIFSVPHSVFRLYSPQVIKGTLRQISNGTEIRIVARPTAVQIIILLSLLCIWSFYTTQVVIGKCDLLFYAVLSFFTIFFIVFSYWQLKECVSILENLLCKSTEDGFA